MKKKETLTNKHFYENSLWIYKKYKKYEEYICENEEDKIQLRI